MTALATEAVQVRHSLDEPSDAPPVIAFIVFMTVLPLEWISIVGGGAGAGEENLKPFHVAALAFIGVLFLRWRPGAVIGPVWRRHNPVYGSYAVVLATAVAGAIALQDPYLPPIGVVRQVFYAGTSLLIAGFVVAIVGRPAQRWLAVTGALASVALALGIVQGLVSQGQNPIAILGQALAQGDPDIITYELLRTTFRTDAELSEVAANLRHQVFLGLLSPVFIGLAFLSAIDRRHRLLRTAVVVASVFGFGLVTLSLSRSTTLAMAIPFLLYPLRTIIRNRARPAQAITLVVAAAATVAVFISPVGALLIERFGSTDSYSNRLLAAGPNFLQHLLPSALIGAPRSTIEISPHNFVLNCWLAGGVTAGIAAVLFLLWFGGWWLREVVRFVWDRPGWVLPVGQMWVIGLGAIPMVRAFTSGNLPHMVEFVAVGMFLGLTLANERAAAALRSRPGAAVPVSPMPVSPSAVASPSGSP